MISCGENPVITHLPGNQAPFLEQPTVHKTAKYGRLLARAQRIRSGGSCIPPYSIPPTHHTLHSCCMYSRLVPNRSFDTTVPHSRCAHKRTSACSCAWSTLARASAGDRPSRFEGCRTASSLIDER